MKSAQLQIRLAPEQKAWIKRRAQQAGEDLSSYVLARVAPRAAVRAERLLQEIARTGGSSFALASLHDFLMGLAACEFDEAWACGLPSGLSLRIENLVAAMVEEAAARHGRAAPVWAAEVVPLPEPWFASDLPGLRAHLLRASPAAFRRRNLFVDATLGARV